MPLAFESMSHGAIAFGFFNIDSDMLLLDRYFFFSTLFCGYIDEIATCEPNESRKLPWQVVHIPDPEKIGDLMGAINGVHFSGFIGEVYKKYPFPQKEDVILGLDHRFGHVALITAFCDGFLGISSTKIIHDGATIFCGHRNF